MKSRVWLVGSFAILAASAHGSGGIVGMWKVDPASPKIDFNQNKVRFVFRKDGTYAMNTVTVKGEGVYRVAGDRVTISLKKRNGKRPNHVAERGTEGKIVGGGRAIVFPSGQVKSGVPVMIRLIRG